MWLSYTSQDQHPQQAGPFTGITNKKMSYRFAYRQHDGGLSQLRFLFPDNSRLNRVNKNKLVSKHRPIEGRALSGGGGDSDRRGIIQQSYVVERVRNPETSHKSSLPNDNRKAGQGSPHQPPSTSYICEGTRSPETFSIPNVLTSLYSKR